MVEAGAEGEGGEDSEVAATSGVEEEDSGVDSGLLLTIIVEQEWDLDHGILLNLMQGWIPRRVPWRSRRRRKWRW